MLLHNYKQYASRWYSFNNLNERIHYYNYETVLLILLYYCIILVFYYWNKKISYIHNHNLFSVLFIFFEYKFVICNTRYSGVFNSNNSALQKANALKTVPS